MEIEIMINEQLKELINDFIKEKSAEIQNGKMIPVDLTKNSKPNETGVSLFTIHVRQRSLKNHN